VTPQRRYDTRSESDVGIQLKDTVYEGSRKVWAEALNDPAKTVDWVIATRDAPGDPIAKVLDVKNPAFLAHFTLVEQALKIRLYHLKGRPPLPNRPLPAELLT